MTKRTGRMGRAPVEAIDAKITEAAARRDTICARMAEGNGELHILDLVEATMELTKLQIERDTIIRNHFNG